MKEDTVNEKLTNKNTRKPRRYNKNLDKTNLKNEIIKQDDTNSSDEKQVRFKKENLKIIPLGGMQEIGKNLTVFEYGNDIIIVDCGLAFPEDDMLGVDLVIPDISYLEKNKDKIRGLVITHGHEDHIGAIPYFLKQINVPIYGTRLTLALIENKLEEHKLTKTTKLKCMKAGDNVSLGKFKVEFIRTTHSIADSVALAIYTPVGVVIHTGDFKVDYTPIDGQPMDFARFAELGKKGVLALLSDSTNAERPGFTMSERSVGDVFEKLFDGATNKRIIVATFASNIHRVQQIVNSAVKYGRKVAICGRSMVNVMSVAKDLGYLNIPENVLIDIDEITNYPEEQMVIITTGSQGEPMSALARMSSGDHRKVVITANDLVIISASPIPGNEKFINKVIDDLFKIGAEVVYHSLADIHVSGHACQEELKLMLSLVKPKYFMPVHGEYRHLKQHQELAHKVGISPKNTFLMSNGKVLELNRNYARITSSVPSGRILVDGLGVGDVGNIVLRDRQHLSQDGLIIIVLTMDSASGTVVAGPEIISRGFVYVRESENLMDNVKQVVKHEINEFEAKNITDWTTIKTGLRDSLKEYLYQKTKRNPMILPIIMEI